MLLRDLHGVENGRLVTGDGIAKGSFDSEEPILIRLATKKESLRGMTSSINGSLPDKEGYEHAYMPYGPKGAGFYFVKPRKTRDSLPTTEFQGIKIAIENRKGSTRTGEDEDGEEWKTKMFYPYGYIINTEGVDGDEIDCFVGPVKDAKDVFIIHQRVDGQYDEDKCMMGFGDELHARDAFLAHYDDQSYLGKITRMTVEDFKAALKNHKRGTKIAK